MRIELSYQTQGIPAPYAFSAYFNIWKGDKHLDLEFKQQYLDREEVSAEEVLAEGFSENDDYNWNGELSGNWGAALDTLLNAELLDHPQNDFYIHLAKEDHQGFPNLPDDVLIQELIQAVFEASKREAPLTFSFSLNGKEQSLSWHFTSRAAFLDQKEVKWQDSITLMQSLYAAELDEMKSSKKPVERSISFDSKNWIELNSDEFWDRIVQLQT